MTTPLTLAPHIATRLIDHATRQAPHECCGILLGPTPHHAKHARPTKNVHPNPRTEYEIDPHALHDAIQRTHETPLHLVGFYHSHPRGPAAFSTTDHDQAAWPNTPYLIVSLQPITFHAGRWNGDTFDPLPVNLDAGP